MKTRNRRAQATTSYKDQEDIKDLFKLNKPLKAKKFNNVGLVQDMEGKEFTYKYIQQNGFKNPVRFRKMDGLGMKMPKQNRCTVAKVMEFVGETRELYVQDCENQVTTKMLMNKFVEYWSTPEDKRVGVLNVLSLEVSGTALDKKVRRPRIVDDLDWIDLCYPVCHKYPASAEQLQKQEFYYPKVQKYCLMSAATSYTNFHIDFAGTSVWYHVLKGKKVFWLIEPTESNLEAYKTFQRAQQIGANDSFLGDLVDRCERVELEEGNTFLIPSGWIHAVFTPQDSIVFGGNFLHSFGIELQLKVEGIEKELKNSKKMSFPMLIELQWYTLERYVHCLLGETYVDCDCDPKTFPVDKEEKYLTQYEHDGLTKLMEKLGNHKHVKDMRLKNLHELYDRAQDMLATTSCDIKKIRKNPIINSYPHKPVEDVVKVRKQSRKRKIDIVFQICYGSSLEMFDLELSEDKRKDEYHKINF